MFCSPFYFFLGTYISFGSKFHVCFHFCSGINLLLYQHAHPLAHANTLLVQMCNNLKKYISNLCVLYIFHIFISDNTFWTYLSGFSVKGNYLINYLANRGPELQPFVTGSLIQLLCRVTKFGWFDDDRFRDVAKESMKFLSQVNIYLVQKNVVT